MRSHLGGLLGRLKSSNQGGSDGVDNFFHAMATLFDALFGRVNLLLTNFFRLFRFPEEAGHFGGFRTLGAENDAIFFLLCTLSSRQVSGALDGPRNLQLIQVSNSCETYHETALVSG